MDKYIKLYRQLSPDEKHYHNSHMYLNYADKIFDKKMAKKVIGYAQKIADKCDKKRAESKKELLDLVKAECKPYFKSHCVVCGGRIIAVDNPRKAQEYESRGNYCAYCHAKGNDWAKKGFYKGDMRDIFGIVFEKAKGRRKPPKPQLTKDDLIKGRRTINIKSYEK